MFYEAYNLHSNKARLPLGGEQLEVEVRSEFLPPFALHTPYKYEVLNVTDENGNVSKPTTEDAPKKSELIDMPEAGGHIMGRGDFFTLTGFMALLSILGVSVLGFTRFMFPRVLFEPSTRFKAGFPEEYVIGEISVKWKKAQKVWIIREEDGFYALLAQCTHLGCTPGWFQAENKFKCFCHGSGFRKSGINFEGPAPRPLERVLITIAEDGQLLIDKAVRFRQEKNEWGKAGAFLKI